MKLYHGTTAKIAKLALREGLSPRGDRPSQWKMASAKDRVYLTNSYALYFAANASAGDSDEQWGVVEVDTTRLYTGNLCPDEDFLEQATRDQPDSGCPVGLKTMVQRTKWFRKHAHKGYQKFWEASVKHLGNCAHIGPIAKEAITQVALFNPKSNPYITMRSLDPTITLMNYKILGDAYQALVRWLFDPAVTVEEILGRLGSTTSEIPGFVDQKEYVAAEIQKRDGIHIGRRVE